MELKDVDPKRDSDTKRVAKTIKIGGEIGIPGLIKAHVEWVKEHITHEHTDLDRATAGERGAATAGYAGAATAGEYGAATSKGKASVGEHGIACVRGHNVKVRGGIGALLVIGVENDYNYEIKAWKAVVVDGEIIKVDTWYKLKDGEMVETEQ